MERRRVARVCLPTLLDRCRQVLLSFVHDDNLFGDIPFPRCASLRVSHWTCSNQEFPCEGLKKRSSFTCFDNYPNYYCGMEDSPTLLQMTYHQLKGLARRGDKAHLFYFFGLLVDVACSLRRAPTAWRARMEEPGESRLMEVDARGLARKCLKVLGSEVCTVS